MRKSDLGCNMNKEGQENMSDNSYLEPEKRLPPDEMPLPPLEPVKADNPMERLMVLLATAFSAFIAILDILGIEFFKGTKQTGDILIIALCIPLVLIVIF